MPTEEFLLDLDVKKIRESLLDVLTYKDEHGILLAMMVIFESCVVLASLEEGYTRASTECLRRKDRPATNGIKSARDTIAHAYYNRDAISKRIKLIAKYHYIERLYVKFFDKAQILGLCRDFEKRLETLYAGSGINNKYVANILGKMPPSSRVKYTGSDVDVALQFACDMLERL